MDFYLYKVWEMEEWFIVHVGLRDGCLGIVRNVVERVIPSRPLGGRGMTSCEGSPHFSGVRE
jgi:hypothetical protein